MVIGIDAREVQQFPTGIGRYFGGLVAAIAEIKNKKLKIKNIRFILFVNRGNPLIRKNYPEGIEVKIVRARPKSFLQQIFFPIEIWISFKGGKEKILLTNPFGFTLFCPVPQALVVLDLIYKHFPQEASFKAKLYDAVLGRLAARCAKAILTCSENSKKDIVRFLGISKEKVVVTPLGAPSEILKRVQDGKSVLEKYKIEKPYILYVGNMRGHKNVGRLVTAFAEVKSKDLESLNLIIVGSDVNKRIKNYELRITNYGLPEFVKILRSVPDKDLFTLYREAEMLTQPSLYEGFGMSVLEAMACGCPVVASNASSLPEVGGDVPVYVGPKDSRNIARGILRVLGYNREERREMIARGLEQAGKFSWEEMARKTVKALVANLDG